MLPFVGYEINDFLCFNVGENNNENYIMYSVGKIKEINPALSNLWNDNKYIFKS